MRSGLTVLAMAWMLGAGVAAGAAESATPAAAAVPGKKAGEPRTAEAAPARERTLYLVGYSHLDTQWCWDYRKTIGSFLPKTVFENFALLDRHPRYVFNFSGANRYRMLKEYYPRDFERVKAYVAAGRWFPCGSSWEESDVNVPSPESLVRQMLYGNLFFRRELGRASTEYMLPDCFGFPASLPTVLAHGGVKGFSTQKLTWHSAAGIPFNIGRWIGPDGRGVVAALNASPYGGPVTGDLSRDAGWLRRLDENAKRSGLPVDYLYFGTGDMGGAPPESSVKWMEVSAAGGGPVRVIPSTAERMFNEVTDAEAARLPSYRGDLLLTEHSAGSLSSQAYMKRWNRRNERLAQAAEGASVAAAWLGGAPYPKERLRSAWGVFLGTQFHDILPGTSIPPAYEFAWNDEALAMNQFAAVLTDAAGAVSRAMDTRTPAGAVPLLVYNPVSAAREDVVEAEVALPPELMSAAAAEIALCVTGPDGTEAPAQVVSVKDGRAKILFLAVMPACGFAVYAVQAAPASGNAAKSGGELTVSAAGLENARYRVVLDANGDIGSIFDKAAGRELLSAPARLALLHEKPAEYPSWNMDWADRQKPPRTHVAGTPSVKVVESGPVRVALEVTRKTEDSTFVQTIRLAAGGAGDRVEVACRIDWRGKESSLKAVFPLTVSNPEATYNLEFGTVRRGNNDPKKYEVPSHQWFDLTAADGSYGVTVLEDSKYGSDKPDDRTLRLTLLFTPGAGAWYGYGATQDWGRHEMLYALAGHLGNWNDAGAPWIAARLNNPLLPFAVPAHPGPLGRRFSLIAVDGPSVVVCALKQAEDGDEVIVRLHELYGRPAKGVRVSFPGGKILAAREVNGQEQPLGPAVVRDGCLVADFDPYQPRAFALKLGGAPATVPAPASRKVRLSFDEDVISLDGERDGGNFDGSGNAIPGEMLPEILTVGGVEFALGPSAPGRRNAVACRGQTIRLPADGRASGVYVLAAASGGDTHGTFRVGQQACFTSVQDWDSFIGQWDCRLWKGSVPDVTYHWDYELVWIRPGFIKRDEVAWFCSHRHSASGTNEPYAYSYLYVYRLPLAPGSRTLTLPYNPGIHVMAVTLVREAHDGAVPARPLGDTLPR